jgi:hypothetical protein
MFDRLDRLELPDQSLPVAADQHHATADASVSAVTSWDPPKREVAGAPPAERPHSVETPWEVPSAS